MARKASFKAKRKNKKSLRRKERRAAREDRKENKFRDGLERVLGAVDQSDADDHDNKETLSTSRRKKPKTRLSRKKESNLCSMLKALTTSGDDSRQNGSATSEAELPFRVRSAATISTGSSSVARRKKSKKVKKSERKRLRTKKVLLLPAKLDYLNFSY